MRASPRISVLGEGGNPCIVGVGRSTDNKTVIFFWRKLPFSLTDADVCDLDYGGGAVHGHLFAAARNGFPFSPAICEKLAPLSANFFIECNCR